MDDYISKPINEQQLYKLIHKFASASTDEEVAVIDMEYLRSLSKGDEAFEKNMMKAFSEQMPRELNELNNAIHFRDYKRIESSAHTMKSTVSYLGLHQLAPLLEQIESDSEQGDHRTRLRARKQTDERDQGDKDDQPTVEEERERQPGLRQSRQGEYAHGWLHDAPP